MKSVKWDDLFDRGTLLDLNVATWQARMGLRPEDLGLADSADVRKALSFGCIRLADRAFFKDIQKPVNEAERLVDRYSFRFQKIRGCRFVPAKNIEPLLAGLKEQQAKFDEAVSLLLENYEQIKETMLPVIDKALVEAASTPEIAATAMARVREKYPSSAEVRGKFGLTWTAFTINSPKALGIEEIASDEANKVADSLRDMMEQVRREMADRLKDLAELMNSGNKIPERSVKSVQAMLDKVESLNVFGDAALTRQIANMRRWLSAVDEGVAPAGLAIAIREARAEAEADVARAVEEAVQSMTTVGQRRLINVPDSDSMGSDSEGGDGPEVMAAAAG